MADFKPFENDEQSWSGGEGDGLTINNGSETMSIYGEIKFAATDQGGAAAKELLAIFQAAGKYLMPGESTKSLWVKNRGGAVVIGGDVDLEKGKSGLGTLSKAVAALEKLTSGTKPKPNPEPRGPKA